MEYYNYHYDPWQHDDPEDRTDYQYATENETVVVLLVGLMFSSIIVVELVRGIFC